MRSRKRTVKWNIFFHYSTIVYAILSGVVLVPLYLKFIPLDIFGAWLAASNVVAWISIVDPGLSSVVMQKVSAAYGSRDEGQLNGLLTNGVILSFAISLVGLGVGFLVAPFLFSFLNLDQTSKFAQLDQAFVTAIVGTSLMIFSYGITSFNQGLQSSVGIGLVLVATNLVSLLFTVILLFEGYGLMALALAIVFRGVGLIIGNIAYLIWRSHTEKLCLRISFSGLKELAVLMSYTFLGRAAGTIANSMDALIITRFLGPEIAPIYVLTKKVPDLSRIFLERPSIAFMPAIANLQGVGDLGRAREVLLRLLRLTVWFMGLAFVGFCMLNESFVTLWVGAQLFAGASINCLIMMQITVLVMASVLSNLCYALGNIRGNSVAMLGQGILSIIFMILGAKYFGMIGVVLAPLFGTLLVSGWYQPRIFVELLELNSLDTRRLIQESLYVFIASTLTATVLTYFDNPANWYAFLIMVLVTIVGYFGILYVVSCQFRRECLNWRRLD